MSAMAFPQRPPIQNVGPRGEMSPTTIQKMLDENHQLIMTIVDYQSKGQSEECSKFQGMLHRNLVYLATIADSNNQAVQGGVGMQMDYGPRGPAAGHGPDQPTSTVPHHPSQFHEQYPQFRPQYRGYSPHYPPGYMPPGGQPGQPGYPAGHPQFSQAPPQVQMQLQQQAQIMMRVSRARAHQQAMFGQQQKMYPPGSYPGGQGNYPPQYRPGTPQQPGQGPPGQYPPSYYPPGGAPPHNMPPSSQPMGPPPHTSSPQTSQAASMPSGPPSANPGTPQQAPGTPNSGSPSAHPPVSSAPVSMPPNATHPHPHSQPGDMPPNQGPPPNVHHPGMQPGQHGMPGSAQNNLQSHMGSNSTGGPAPNISMPPNMPHPGMAPPGGMSQQQWNMQQMMRAGVRPKGPGGPQGPMAPPPGPMQQSPMNGMGSPHAGHAVMSSVPNSQGPIMSGPTLSTAEPMMEIKQENLKLPSELGSGIDNEDNS